MDRPSPWAEFAAAHPPGYFATREGQERAREGLESGIVSQPPPGWSLPPELGPWPADPVEIGERVLSLLPDITPAILGDLIFGPWRFRSGKFRAEGEGIVEALVRQGRAKAQLGHVWSGYFATTPVCPAVPVHEACEPNVRAFLDRRRLAVLDATTGKRLEARRAADLAALAQLEELPVDARSPGWQEDVDTYRGLAAEWSVRPPMSDTY